MKKLTVSLMVVGALTLAGCSASVPTVTNTNEITKTLKDGREVTCIIVTSTGGMSCDWENAK